jgi:hypothetical protein
MTRDEMTINSEDLGDIFGIAAAGAEAVLTKEKDSHTTAPIAVPVEIRKEAVKSPIVQNKILDAEKEVIESLPPMNDVDDLVKRAKEIEAELKGSEPAAATAPEATYKEAVGPKHMKELLAGFDELRRVMYSELEGIIDKKAVENMLLRTLEKSATSFFILKNTNWSHDGNLRMDGSIDTERFMKNTEADAAMIGEVDRAMEEALCGLLFLRLKSIKLGLGKDKYSAICSRLVEKMEIIKAGYGAGSAGVLKNRVLAQAIIKGDETQ